MLFNITDSSNRRNRSPIAHPPALLLLARKSDMLARLVSPTPQRSHVYVYRGEGAGWRSVRSTCESLTRLLPPAYEVRTLSCRELLSGGWAAAAALLVMPGGADLPYCKRLNGRGNTLIREFVGQGGRYLGLCAGAYYASARVDFEPGTPLQVVGDRELCFFAGTARGAAFEGFDYLTEAGAVAAAIQFRVPAELAEAHQEQQQQQQQLQEQQPLVVTQPAGDVQEQHRSSSRCFTRDYCNGGPFFVCMDGSHDLEQLPGVTVLATYCNLPARTDVSFQAVTSGSNSSLAQLVDSTAGSEPAAALRCDVGAGVAVLCGTHPELSPAWLDACGGTRQGPVEQQGAAATTADSSSSSSTSPDSSWDAAGVVCVDAQLSAAAAELQQQLAAAQPQRDLFLSVLLYEALRKLPS